MKYITLGLILMGTILAAEATEIEALPDSSFPKQVEPAKKSIKKVPKKVRKDSKAKKTDPVKCIDNKARSPS